MREGGVGKRDLREKIYIASSTLVFIWNSIEQC